MKHSGFNKKETWYKEGYKYCKAAQIEMIKKYYPNYNENEWVLWVVPDLFHNFETVELVGTIEIKKKDGSLIDFSYMVRSPYPNKMIRQLSIKNGRKRLYGIPLVFKTFEDLSKVSEIKIKWELFEEWTLDGIKEKPFDLHYKSLLVKYNLAFEKDKENPDFHFFTVFSKDNTYDVYEEKDADRIKEYYDEFDIALNVEGDIICYEEELETDLYDIFDLKGFSDDLGNELTDDEQIIVNNLGASLPEREKLYNLLESVVSKSEIQWESYYYEKTETLTSAYMADIITESCFGFEHISEVS